MPVEQLPAQAPDFTLDHVLGHQVSLSDFRGRTVVVIFGGRESAEQVKLAVEAIRERYSPDELPVIGISDVQKAPRPARPIVKRELKKAHEQAVSGLSARLQAQGKQLPNDASQGVIMVMDWTGDVVRSYGVSDVGTEAVAVLVAPDGRVAGTGTGAQAGEQVLAQLQ
jgi:hypothetical protein